MKHCGFGLLSKFVGLQLELWLSGPQSASIPCGICNCEFCSANCEVFSDFSLLVRNVRLPTFLFCFLDYVGMKHCGFGLQIVKFCRASVCKLELWLSGPQSASIPCGICNCACSVQQTVKSFRTSVCSFVRLPTFLFCFLDYVGMKHCGFGLLSKL